MARVEAMMERGEVFSEPASLSRTDELLDALLARARRSARAGGVSAGSPRLPSRPPAAADGGMARANWLDLPSLSELLDLRRNLLMGDQQDWRDLGPDTGIGDR